MKEVFKTRNIQEAEIVQSILAGDNIVAEVLDANFNKMSGFPVRIVVSDEDEERALEIIKVFIEKK